LLIIILWDMNATKRWFWHLWYRSLICMLRTLRYLPLLILIHHVKVMVPKYLLVRGYVVLM
jgi:hypothetical protein